MKGFAIQPYIDKHTGKAYNIGDKIEYADDRARFLAEKGYVKLEDVEKAEPVAKVEIKAEGKAEVKVVPKKPAAKKPTTSKATKKK